MLKSNNTLQGIFRFAGLYLLLLLQVEAVEMPDASEMGDTNFEKREIATYRMRSWAINNHRLACDKLSRLYFTTQNPETRTRLRWVLEQISMNQPKSYLGVSYKIEKQTPEKLGTPLMLHVKRLKKDGPAESGGIVVGDKIIAVGGKVFSSKMEKAEISAILSSLPSGEKVAFVVLREEQKISIYIRPLAKEMKPADVQAAGDEFELWLDKRKKELGHAD